MKLVQCSCFRYFCCGCKLLLPGSSWALTGEIRQHGEERAVGRDFVVKRYVVTGLAFI